MWRRRLSSLAATSVRHSYLSSSKAPATIPSSLITHPPSLPATIQRLSWKPDGMRVCSSISRRMMTGSSSVALLRLNDLRDNKGARQGSVRGKGRRQGEVTRVRSREGPSSSDSREVRPLFVVASPREASRTPSPSPSRVLVSCEPYLTELIYDLNSEPLDLLHWLGFDSRAAVESPYLMTRGGFFGDFSGRTPVDSTDFSKFCGPHRDLAGCRCNECGQSLPESYAPPADEPWTTGIFGCAEDKDS